jgi:RNA polymerase sigma-70 factor (ECF subfamily)
MATEGSFRELIARVRAGDEGAAAELVGRYEPPIRRAARVRLRDPRLGRLLDSMDICQSVLASFFVRAALGQYELSTPEQLLRLLVTMTRNKVAGQANAQRAGCRDQRRVVAAVDDRRDVAASDPSPSRQVAARELLEEARRLLSPEERALMERRAQGDDWAAIAAELGGSPDALRMRLARAVGRVAGHLGLDEDRP